MDKNGDVSLYHRPHSVGIAYRGERVYVTVAPRRVEWLFADLGVGGQVFGFDAAAAEPLGSLALGGEVLGLDPLVHQAGRFQGDLLAKLGM